MINQKRKGYVTLPETCMLRAAKAYDGGIEYEDVDVQCSSRDGRVHTSYQNISIPGCPSVLKGQYLIQGLLLH